MDMPPLDEAIAAAVTAVEQERLDPLRPLAPTDTAVVAVDRAGDHAVAFVVLRDGDGDYHRTEIFLTRESGGCWQPPTMLHSGSFWPSTLTRAGDTLPEILSPIANPTLSGHARDQRDERPRHGHRFVSGVAARSVTAIELTSSRQSRRRAPDALSGAFIVMVEATLEEALEITALTTDGRAIPIEI
jgi:hypothetical protein